jgi:putative addiction module component (TIGR02574 family)
MQNTKLDAALAVALELPDEDRRRLVGLICESLPEDADDTEYDPAQISEWNRRLEEYRAGRTQAVSTEEVLARVRKKYDR